MCARRSGINRKQLEKYLEGPYYQRNPQIAAHIDAELTGSKDSESQRMRRNALVPGKPHQAGMVTVPDKVSVRITRYIPDGRHEQDDDNTNGGVKRLRDAIAALLSRKGDSKKDGFESWEIVTETGPFGLKVEVYEEDTSEE